MQKSLISILLFFLVSCSLFSSDPKEDIKPILEEGLYLYRLEKASWHGTDLFYNEFKNIDEIKGYFSYPDGNKTKCIFFQTLNYLK